MSENQSMRKMKDRKEIFSIKTTSLATQEDKKDEKNTEKRGEERREKELKTSKKLLEKVSNYAIY